MYDQRHRETLRDYLKKEMDANGPSFSVYRPDVERVGANMGLDSSAAAAVFESMKDQDWWGVYHYVGQEPGWILAVVERVA